MGLLQQKFKTMPITREGDTCLLLSRSAPALQDHLLVCNPGYIIGSSLQFIHPLPPSPSHTHSLPTYTCSDFTEKLQFIFIVSGIHGSCEDMGPGRGPVFPHTHIGIPNIPHIPHQNSQSSFEDLEDEFLEFSTEVPKSC